MNFILKMAWRDSRASRQRLALFSSSVVLGIAALVAIGSFTVNLKDAIDLQAKGLLGADLIVTSRAAPDADLKTYLDALGGEQSATTEFSSMLVFPTAANATRLVQVRAVEKNFPFFGDFETSPADAPARLRAGEAVVILEETLLNQFNVKPGDSVKLGKATFIVAAALKKVPGESSAIATFAPRAFIPMSRLESTELGNKENLAVHRVLLKLPAGRDPDVIDREIRDKFRGRRVSAATVAERKRDLGQVLTNIEGFLNLVGFIALFLGAIGVASAIHVYVRQKITTVAVLRCLGASAGQSFAVYLVQGFALGIFGAVLGGALGVALQLSLPAMLKGMLPFQVDFFIAWAEVGRGMAAGLVISLLFTLLPLLAVRRVSPLVALRSAFAERVGGVGDPWRILIVALIVVAVTGFAYTQTHNWRIGLGFTGMLAVGFGVLAGLAAGVAWAARRWVPRALPYVVRQGVANLHRPNNRTVLLLLSLGLGTFLILTLYLTRTTLLREIDAVGGGSRPNLLFFDIQDDQIEAFDKLAVAQGAPVLQQAPIVTMKIAALKGRTVQEITRPRVSAAPDLSLSDDPNPPPPGSGTRRGAGGGRLGRGGEPGGRMANGMLGREYRSTYRGKLSGTERVVAGKFDGQVSAGVAVVPISVEESFLKSLQLELGDEIEWDVQGVPVRTKVTSVRAVEWRRLDSNFFVVFPEGAIEGAPKTFVAALRTATPADSARVQREVVGAFPNVSAIDLALVMETLDSIFSKVAFVIQFMALFTVATGIIVLAGAVLSGRYQRVRETVLLRTLGATRRQLVQIQMVEYAILGVLAAVVGGGLAIAGNALLAKYVFHLTPSAPPLLVLGAVAIASSVTLITGLLANRGVTDHPPLEILRQET
jgi:putative ABC transport system permease protein